MLSELRSLFLVPLLAVFAACQGEETCEECQVGAVPNEGWTHVAEGSAIPYENNPPASGPHYPTWAVYAVHTSEVPRGYWVHNVEHGGLVLLYRPEVSQEEIDALEAIYQAVPVDPWCGIRRAVMTADSSLDSRVAAVVADHVIEGDSLEESEVIDLYNGCRCTAPENECADGTYY